MKKTLVIGASENPERYSFKAISMLREYKHSVVAIGLKKGKVNDVDFSAERPNFDDIDTVSLYLNPSRQKNYYDYIISLKPKRIIFNPGTENPEFKELAKNNNIKTDDACTLVLLKTEQF